MRFAASLLALLTVAPMATPAQAAEPAATPRLSTAAPGLEDLALAPDPMPATAAPAEVLAQADEPATPPQPSTTPPGHEDLLLPPDPMLTPAAPTAVLAQTDELRSPPLPPSTAPIIEQVTPPQDSEPTTVAPMAVMAQAAEALAPSPNPILTTAAPVEVLAQADQLPSPPLPPSTAPIIEQVAPPQNPALLTGRERPGRQPSYPNLVVQTNPGAVSAPPPDAFPTDQIPIPDRWRLSATLGLVNPRWFDPYDQNTLKGDRPILGTSDWFVQVNGVSDTVVEPRSFPTGVTPQSTAQSGDLDSFGRSNSLAISQTFLTGLSLINGSTAFKPPDYQVTVLLAFNYNYTTAPERGLLSVDPTKGLTRSADFVGVQEAFVEFHLRDVSDRYDFDAVRIGIQPFSADFRGFLFQDDPVGIRFFGDRDDNRLQYNLAFFARIEKEANSGLNDLTVPIRKDYLAIANLYRQDFPVPGLTSQVTVIYNANREANELIFNSDGFPVVPALIGNDRARDYDVVYLGYNADGHIDRLNLTASAYAALGRDRDNIFTGKPAEIRSWFVAAEPSYDIDWIRLRLSGLYASGDSKPRGNVETGFDAILENPQFAGADTSYFIRQSIPFVGGGLVGLNGRNGVLIDLRSSKDEGQSNFVNPGTVLLGGGADFDLTPQLRVSGNINHIWFSNTAVIEDLRQQGAIPTSLGWDYSVAAIWRPWLTQNIVLRLSGAVFSPDIGFDSLLATNNHGPLYSVLFNAVLSF